MATQHPHEAVTWPCHKCTAPGVRNLGSQGWCAAHLEQLYSTFSPDVFAVGVQDGPERPDWGAGYADLRCNACAATWVGIAGDPCEWCRRARQRQLEYQAELVLTPPDVDPGDERSEAMHAGWAHRLAVAVAAGIVTDAAARRAWDRGARRGAA